MWSLPSFKLPSMLQKRLIKFILKRTFGQLIESNIQLDQLDFSIGTTGTLILRDLNLNIEGINQLLPTWFPLILTNGSISSLQLSIPWLDLEGSSCIMDIKGVQIHCKFKSLEAEPLFEKEIPDLINSVYIANDFLTKQQEFKDSSSWNPSTDPDINPHPSSILLDSSTELDSPFIGVHYLAQLIDTILLNLKVYIHKCIIQIHLPLESFKFIELNIPESFLIPNPSNIKNETTPSSFPNKILTLSSFYISSSSFESSSCNVNLNVSQRDSSPHSSSFHPMVCTIHPTLVEFKRLDNGWRLVSMHLKKLQTFFSPQFLKLCKELGPYLATLKLNSLISPLFPSSTLPPSHSSLGTTYMIDPSRIPTTFFSSFSSQKEALEASILSVTPEFENPGLEKTLFFSMVTESSISSGSPFSFLLEEWSIHFLASSSELFQNEAWNLDTLFNASIFYITIQTCFSDSTARSLELHQLLFHLSSIPTPVFQISTLHITKHRIHIPKFDFSFSPILFSHFTQAFDSFHTAFDLKDLFVSTASNFKTTNSSLPKKDTLLTARSTQIPYHLEIGNVRIQYTLSSSTVFKAPLSFELLFSRILTPFSFNSPQLALYDTQLKLNDTLIVTTCKETPSIFQYSFTSLPSSFQSLFTSLPSFQLSPGLSSLFSSPYFNLELPSLHCVLHEEQLQLYRSILSTTHAASHSLPYVFRLYVASLTFNETLLHTLLHSESLHIILSNHGILLSLSQSKVFIPNLVPSKSILIWEQVQEPLRFWYDPTTLSRQAYFDRCKLFFYPCVMKLIHNLRNLFYRLKKNTDNTSDTHDAESSFLKYFSNLSFANDTFAPFHVVLKQFDFLYYPPVPDDFQCIHHFFETCTVILTTHPTLRLHFHRFHGTFFLDTYQWVQFQVLDVGILQRPLSTFPFQIFVDNLNLKFFFTPTIFQLSKKITLSLLDYFSALSEPPLNNTSDVNHEGNPPEDVSQLIQSILNSKDTPSELYINKLSTSTSSSDSISTPSPASATSTSSNLAISVVDDFISFEDHLDQTIVLLNTDPDHSFSSESSYSHQFMALEIVENHFADDSNDDCFSDPFIFSPTGQENAAFRFRQAKMIVHIYQETHEPIAELHVEGHLETKQMASMHWATRLKLIHVSILDKCMSSTWHKLLTFEKHLYNVKLDWDWVRSEHRLVLQCQPMKLHLDQETLQALFSFFSPTLSTSTTTIPNALFFQRVEIYPMNIKLDYKPKKVDFNDLQSGQFLQLLNFFHLEGAELVLQHAIFTGVHGVEELIHLLTLHWLPHIKHTQLGNMVSGVGPLRSFVNLGSGVVDLVLLPVSQYRKEGKVIKGLQRGAHSFVKAAAVETLSLGAKLSVGTHTLLRKADCFLENQPPPVHSSYAHQPKDLKEGIELAYKSISKNVSQAAKVLAMPIETLERDKTGAMRQVLRAVPIAILKPMLGATEAMGKTLMGLRNTVDPTKKMESQDKYKPI